MTTAIDQKAYLQKYLGGSSFEKKKKKKKNVKGKGFKIIDDDLDLSKLRPLDGDEIDILNDGEDAPQIAGIIDERPEELRKLDDFQSSSKWRVINQDDGFNSKLKVEEFKKNRKEIEKENEIVFGKMYSDSEDEKKNDSDVSPPRKDKNKKMPNTKKKVKHHNDSDFSPPNNDDNKNYDSDMSPPRKNLKKDSQHNVISNSDASAPKQKYSENSKSKQKHNSEYSHQKKHSKEVTSKNMSSTNKSDSDASPPRKKDDSKKVTLTYDSDPSPPRRIENKSKERIRKPSRWGDFKEDDMKSGQKAETSRTSNRKDNPKISPNRSQMSQKKDIQNNSRYNSYENDASPPKKSQRDSSRRNRDSDSDISPPRKRKHSPGIRMFDKHSHKNNISSKRYQQTMYSEQPRKRSMEENYKRRQESDSDFSPPRKERNQNYDKKHKQSQTQRKRYDSDSDLSPVRKEKTNQERRNYRRNSDEPPPTNKKMEKTLQGKKAGLQDAEQLKHENEAFRRKEDEAFKNMTDEMSGRNAQVVSRKGKRETSKDRQKQKQKAERQRELDEKYKKWSKGLKQIESQQAAVEDFIHEASKPLARYKDDRDLESRLKHVERDGDPMLEYMREKKREKGELGPEKPTYKGNFPPNRFNIRPGYRWDGVDRSNGYEKKYFEQQSKRKAQQEELYKWNSEDL